MPYPRDGEPLGLSEEEWRALEPDPHVTWGPKPHPLDTELMDWVGLVHFEWSEGDDNGFSNHLVYATNVHFTAHLAQCGMCRLHAWRLSEHVRTSARESEGTMSEVDERNEDPYTCDRCDSKLLLSEVSDGLCGSCTSHEQMEDGS